MKWLNLLAVLLALASCQPAYAGGVSGAPGTLDATLVDPPTSAQYPRVIVSGTPAVGGTVAVSNLPGTVDTGPGAAGASTQRGVLSSDGQSVVSQLPYPYGATPIALSGSGSNSSTTQTLTGASGKTTYLSGLAITGGGATSASIVNANCYLAGTAVSLYFAVPVPAGSTVGLNPLVIRFDPPLSAGAQNSVIQCTLPALGSGNTSALLTVWGFRL